MEILILCGIYAVELACYLLGLQMLFDLRVRTWKWMAAGVILPIGIGVLPIGVTEKTVLIGISIIGVMFLSIESRRIAKSISTVLTFLLLECLDGILAYPCNQILEHLNMKYKESVNQLLIVLATVLCICLVNLIKEKVFQYRKTHINLAIYFIIGIIAISMMFCLSFLNHVIIYLNNNKYIIVCNILNIAIYFSIVFLVIAVIYIMITHERMEQLLKTEQLLKEAQVNYYKQLLKKETVTRRYRHDMVNHLIFVQELLSRNRKDDAQRYLMNILGGFRKIENIYYVVGNEMIDAIMNYFFGMLPQDVLIEIKGKSPVSFDMEETEICAIFSNVFQNAVEEILKNNLQNRCIMVESKKGKQYVEYVIKNTTSLEINEIHIDKNGLPRSCKKDKHDHGIGMFNIKRTVERNNGKFEWFCKDGYFYIKLILPIKSI